MLDIMNHLTKCRGGDGEGVAYFKTPNVSVDKGIKQNPENSVEIIKNIKNQLIGNQFFYHTRKASKGPVIDLNVQPFKLSNNSAFCHNGTWIKSDDWARSLLLSNSLNFKNYRNFSDTKIILIMLKRLGFQFLDHVNSGVFMEFKKNQAVVSVYSGQFEACQINGKWYYASTFDNIHDNHVEFKKDTKAILKPNGYKVIKGKTEERKEHSTVYRGRVNNYSYNGYRTDKINSNNKNNSNTTKLGFVKDNSEKVNMMWKERNKNIITIFSSDGKPVYKYDKTTGKEIDIKEIDKPKKSKRKGGKLSKREKNMIAMKYTEQKSENENTVEIERNKNVPSLFKSEDAEKILETKEQLSLYKKIVLNCKCPVNYSGYKVLEYSSEDEAITMKALIIRMIKDFNYCETTIIMELGLTYYESNILLPVLKKQYEEIMKEYMVKKKE